MEPEVQIWLALIGPAVVVAVAFFGGLYRVLTGITHRIVALDEKLDEQTNELKESVNELYVKHEDRDQQRHTENVQRLTRLETMVNGRTSPWPNLSH